MNNVSTTDTEGRGDRIARLSDSVDELLDMPKTSTQRLSALADICTSELERYGLPGVRGGSRGELRVGGLARVKAWDVAYEFSGKFRLLISLKSILANISGSVPNRIDDLIGEAANVQQLAPEVVIGYVVVFNTAEEKVGRGGRRWSDFFEQAIKSVAIRGAPLWNQGLLEGVWFIRIDSSRSPGERLVQPEKAAMEGEVFFRSLLRKLAQREPAILFSKPIEEL